MNKQKMLKIVNPVLGLLLVNQAVTGIMHDSLPHEAFEILHMGGLLLVLLAAVHVWLNWSWVKANFLRVPAKRSDS